MIEIPIIYGRNTEGEVWIEYVCATREEAQEKIAYLKKKQVVVPEIEDKIWNELGLGFLEREFIIKNLQDFQTLERIERTSFSIEYDYINDTSEYEQIESEGFLRVRVIKVSGKNSKENYIHWLVRINEQGEPDPAQIVYKISLPEATPVGKEGTINLNEFKIVKRPGGFTYRDRSGTNRILHSECWLFVKYPHE